MLSTNDNKHLLVLTHGREDGGARATLAFALGVSLQAMGSHVVMYLNSQAAVWAFEWAVQSVDIPGFDSLQTYISLFEESSGDIYVCASCVDSMSTQSTGTLPPSLGPFRHKVTPAGVTTLASLMIERKTISF